MVGQVQTDGKVGEQLISHMTKVYRCLKAIMREEAVRQELSLTQYIALRMLDVHGSLTMSELHHYLDITQGAATTVVDKLIARGLVMRIALPADRRVVIVQNTNAGTQMVQRVLAGTQEQIDEILQVLPADEHDEVVRGFAHFARVLDLSPLNSLAVEEAACKN